MHSLVRRVTERARGVASGPLAEETISAAEAELGFELPSLLREIYLNVGDHGFGPGHGFLPLRPIDAGDPSVVALYVELRQPNPENPGWTWPERLLPLCDWGCAMYSCVGCSAPPFAVVTFEYVADAPVSASLAPTRESFAGYLADWLDGKDVFEPVYVDAPELSRTAINPFTKQPMIFMGRKPRFWP